MKIGFLDSGIGGLTVLEAFCKNFHSTQKNNLNTVKLSEILYFADLKNLPYGGKSLAALTEILIQNLNYLSSKVDLIVLACNTSSALMNKNIKKNFSNLQIIDLISVLTEQIQNEYSDLKKIAIFSTLATHEKGTYKKNLQNILPISQIISIPCPAFVPLIEDEINNNSPNLISQINELALSPLNDYAKNLSFEPEAIIFGCTHYPLLEPAFKKVFPNSLLLNPADALSQKLQNYKITAQTKFNVFSTAQEKVFEAKLNSLKNILSCVQYLPNTVQIAEII